MEPVKYCMVVNDVKIHNTGLGCLTPYFLMSRN